MLHTAWGWREGQKKKGQQVDRVVNQFFFICRCIKEQVSDFSLASSFVPGTTVAKSAGPANQRPRLFPPKFCAGRERPQRTLRPTAPNQGPAMMSCQEEEGRVVRIRHRKVARKPVEVCLSESASLVLSLDVGRRKHALHTVQGAVPPLLLSGGLVR